MKNPEIFDDEVMELIGLLKFPMCHDLVHLLVMEPMEGQTLVHQESRKQKEFKDLLDLSITMGFVD